jgi:DNA-binding NarL/FixJ family response regulator
MVVQEKRLILVVDDNRFNREGLVLYLESAGYVTCQAGNERDAYAAAISGRPLGAIVDIVIPAEADREADLGENVGLDLVAKLKRLNPEMGIVVFSAYDDRSREIWSMVREGTRGLAYMVKGSRPEQLLDALEQALAGNVVLDPKALTTTRQLGDEIRLQLTADERPWVEHAADLLPFLSNRELEVARRLANSQNVSGIADALGLSQSTVETHVTNVYAKLDLAYVDKRAPSLRKSTLLAKAYMLYELALMGAKPQ